MTLNSKPYPTARQLPESSLHFPIFVLKLVCSFIILQNVSSLVPGIANFQCSGIMSDSFAGSDAQQVQSFMER